LPNVTALQHAAKGGGNYSPAAGTITSLAAPQRQTQFPLKMIFSYAGKQFPPQTQGTKPPLRVNSAPADAERSGIGSAPFREGLLSGACSGKQGRHAKVPLVTAGLGVDSIRLVVLQVEFLLHSPRSCPGGRILQSGDELKDLWAGTCAALDVVQVLAGSQEIRLGAEI